MSRIKQVQMTINASVNSNLKRFQPLYIIAGVIGLALCIVGAFLNLEQFWRSYLLAYVFWSHLALGCLGVVMLHHVAGGRWSAAIRRLMESAMMTLPLMAILFIPLLFGLTTLYQWTECGAGTAERAPAEQNSLSEHSLLS